MPPAGSMPPAGPKGEAGAVHCVDPASFACEANRAPLPEPDVRLKISDHVAAHLAAAIAGQNAPENMVNALRFALLGLHDADFSAPSNASEQARLADLFRQAAPAVADAMTGRLSVEAVHLGVAAISGLIAQLGLQATLCEPRAVLRARLDHAALLADEIDAVLRRCSIEAGGDAFRRSIALTRAVNASAAGRSLQ